MIMEKKFRQIMLLQLGKLLKYVRMNDIYRIDIRKINCYNIAVSFIVYIRKELCMNDYTATEFIQQYNKIFNSIVKEGVPQKNHAVIFLGGQPGVGKSNFYTLDNNLHSYIVIDGDLYRKYHPHYNDIVKYDMENYANRTQPFVNECIEKLVSELSDKGYNLIIEGTLRDPNVPVNTCKMLTSKGYVADMYVVTAEALLSWESTISRANILLDMECAPRLVPIDKYNMIIHALPDNLRKIEDSGCFRSLNIINRNYQVLYPNDKGVTATDVLEEQLKIKEWDAVYEKKADEFLKIKMEVLQQQVIKRKKGR